MIKGKTVCPSVKYKWLFVLYSVKFALLTVIEGFFLEFRTRLHYNKSEKLSF